MANREAGFYWVKRNGSWEVIEFTEEGYWESARDWGFDGIFTFDEHFEEIDERKIERVGKDDFDLIDRDK